MCRTPAIGRSARYSATRTLPGRHTRPRSLRSRSTIITCSARSFALAAIGSPGPAGRVPLIGMVRAMSPRVCRKSSGVAETIDQPSPCRAWAHSAPSGVSAASSACAEPGKRRPQVLHQVDLVDVAPPDGRPHLLDRRRVLRRAPGGDEGAGRERPRSGRGLLGGTNAAGGERQRARLGRLGLVHAGDAGGEAVAEVEVGHHPGRRVGGAEAVAGQEALDPLERIAGRRGDHQPAVACARCECAGGDGVS